MFAMNIYLVKKVWSSLRKISMHLKFSELVVCDPKKTLQQVLGDYWFHLQTYPYFETFHSISAHTAFWNKSWFRDINSNIRFTDKGSNDTGSNDTGSNDIGSNDTGSHDKGSKTRQRVKRQTVKKCDKGANFLNSVS